MGEFSLIHLIGVDMNFENLQGADIERLNECIKAIHKAGLSIGKNTQSGLNHNSGNVWVWDEDWGSGCVYCSIGFDVQWSWSCGDCGEEYDFDTYQEMIDFIDDQNEKTDYSGCKTCMSESFIEAAA
jgi:hypothetical protein